MSFVTSLVAPGRRVRAFTSVIYEPKTSHPSPPPRLSVEFHTRPSAGDWGGGGTIWREACGPSRIHKGGGADPLQVPSWLAFSQKWWHDLGSCHLPAHGAWSEQWPRPTAPSPQSQFGTCLAWDWVHLGWAGGRIDPFHFRLVLVPPIRP